MRNHKVAPPTILESKPIMSYSRKMLIDSLLLTKTSVHSRLLLFYKEQGYECLIVWYDELYSNQSKLKEKVKYFEQS